jgi:hypothetical protein
LIQLVNRSCCIRLKLQVQVNRNRKIQLVQVIRNHMMELVLEHCIRMMELELVHSLVLVRCMLVQVCSTMELASSSMLCHNHDQLATWRTDQLVRQPLKQTLLSKLLGLQPKIDSSEPP